MAFHDYRNSDNSNSNTVNMKPFMSDLKPNWCPGCGDYGLLTATTKALTNLGYLTNEVVIVSGIGCSSSFPHWTNTYGIHMLHGRGIPAATGVKLVNPKLKVIAVGGDGDGLGIGLGHFMHAARRNLDITYMIMNNQIYGLTIGQFSPSSQKGHITITSPEGVNENPINSVALALAAGATFVARGFSGDVKHLQELVEKALIHKGFSYIDVLSPCVTFNKLNTYSWFRNLVYKLEEVNHDINDINAAFSRSLEWNDAIPIGIFYKSERETLHETDPVAGHQIPVEEPLGFNSKKINLEEILNEFR